MPPPDVAPVRDAVIRQLGVEVYWWGRDTYRRATPLALEVVRDGPRFVARVDDLERRRDGTRVDGVLKGVTADGRAWVTTSGGTPVERGAPPPGDWWKKFWPTVEHPVVVHDTIVLPMDCTPRRAPATPSHERMLAAVVDAMREALRGDRKRDVTLVVADFDVDQPATFVLVEGEGDPVYEVSLFDPDDRSDPRWSDAGLLANRVEHDREAGFLRPRIRKHGLVREIALAAPAS